MAQSRNARGFGFLPPLPSVLGTTLRDAEAKVRTTIAAGEAAIGAARNEAVRIGRVAGGELQKSGLVPRQTVTLAGVPKKPVTSNSARQGSPSRPNGSAPARPEKPSGIPNSVVELRDKAVRQSAAVVDGALDSVSFGLWDPAAAAASATFKGGNGDAWQERYSAVRDRQIAQNAYDAKHYAIARSVGGVVGAVAPMVMTGGLAAAPIAVARAGAAIPRTAVGLARAASAVMPKAAAAVGGSVLGAASQVEADLVAGRPLNRTAITSAAIGGGAGGLFGSRDALLGAASSAVAGNVSHAALTGAPVSWDKMALDAGVGVASAALGHRAGHNWSNGLASNQHLAKNRGQRISKEQLGEGLGELLTRLRGERHVGRQVSVPVSGSFTKVDEVTGSWLRSADPYYRERKFGFSAGLTNPQKRAQREYGDRYHVDRFDPMDIGKATGSVAGIAATQAFSDDDPR